MIDESKRAPIAPRSFALQLRRADFAEYAALATRRMHEEMPDALATLKAQLGVSHRALERLRVGWSGWAWTFPMENADARTIGIRLRRRDGSKLAVTGSRQGLFVPRDQPSPARLFIFEGPTDTAAALDLGLAAIGRPSCSGGTRLTYDYVRRAKCQDVVVFADADPAGRRGAASLAAMLALITRVRVTEPPNGIKDLRAWFLSGARRSDVDRVVDETALFSARVEVIR